MRRERGRGVLGGGGPLRGRTGGLAEWPRGRAGRAGVSEREGAPGRRPKAGSVPYCEAPLALAKRGSEASAPNCAGVEMVSPFGDSLAGGCQGWLGVQRGKTSAGGEQRRFPRAERSGAMRRPWRRGAQLAARSVRRSEASRARRASGRAERSRARQGRRGAPRGWRGEVSVRAGARRAPSAGGGRARGAPEGHRPLKRAARQAVSRGGLRTDRPAGRGGGGVFSRGGKSTTRSFLTENPR
jgi:hypothetical protein